MTNSGDKGPIAPRRSLGKSRTDDAPTQPVMAQPYDGGRQTYRVGDETGVQLPVPPGGSGSGPGSGRGGSSTYGDHARGGGQPTGPAPGGAAAGGHAATRAERIDQGPTRRETQKAARAARRAAARRPKQTRRAKLRLTRIDPWSVTKTSFLLSIAFGVMCVVAVFLVFSIMTAAGLWDHINETVQGVVDANPGDEFDITEYVGMSRVMGITMLVAAVDVVLITALATLGAFIYNLSAAMLGGLEVTLAEDVR